jgi:hypothetical protein
MMKEEFEKRCGLELLDEECKEIETAYLESDFVDQKQFFEAWRQAGGIRALFKKSYARLTQEHSRAEEKRFWSRYDAESARYWKAEASKSKEGGAA